MNYRAHIKYFGQIAEFTAKTSEVVSTEANTLAHLLTQLNQTYPGLSDQEFKVAVDHEITDVNVKLTKDVEIALLPPFAGG
jgi:molybdopterin synthase sulfur carrier subunit